MNEFELIRLLTRALPVNDSVVVGPGDDCAVLDLGAGDRQLLFKTDAVVEGVHFTAETPPEKIGRKALARCLSDVAAMAGTPSAALVTLGLPRAFKPEFVEQVYAGMNALAHQHGVAIVGGETTLNPERVLISVALVGSVAKGKAVLRSGAKVGDAIFVTGELGGSLAGKHLDFEPRLVEARWLAERFEVHAMIDLSDGLAGDLRHVLKASGVGAELLKSAIPISRAAKERSRARESAEPHAHTPTHVGDCKPALLAALTDGEDFELLFAVASKSAVPLLDAWKERFPKLRLSCIGKITAGDTVTLRDKTGLHPMPTRGYVHFA
ncbi:MAG TPA: thiamine-phosphate kinase [Verrucomicrobiae bacterium]